MKSLVIKFILPRRLCKCKAYFLGLHPNGLNNSFRSDSPNSGSLRCTEPEYMSRASWALRSCRASMRSSMVPWATSLTTQTLCVCPMRWARSVAWFSTAGFHHGSKWITVSAWGRFRPTPPAFRLIKNRGTWPLVNWSIRSSRFLLCPVSLTQGMPRRGSSCSIRLSICVNCENSKILRPSATISGSMSRSCDIFADSVT